MSIDSGKDDRMGYPATRPRFPREPWLLFFSHELIDEDILFHHEQDQDIKPADEEIARPGMDKAPFFAARTHELKGSVSTRLRSIRNLTLKGTTPFLQTRTSWI